MSAVVLTAPGAITAHGIGDGVLNDAVHRGVQGFQRFFGRDGAWVRNDNAPSLLGPKGLRSLSRECRMFLASTALSWGAAALDARSLAAEDLAVVCATSRSGLAEYAALFREGILDEFHKVAPGRGPLTGLNAPASQAAIRFHAEGPNVTVSSGAAAGLDALTTAADMLEREQAGTVIAGGVDALVVNDECLDAAGVGSAARVPPSDTDVAPATTVPLPFDRRRQGGVDGEAAATLVVQRTEHAAHHEQGWWVEFAGYGTAFAADGDPAGAGRRALASALADAGVHAHAIEAVICSASGDPIGDAAEAECLWSMFGGRAWVCSVNGSVGCTAGATGLLQAIVAMHALDPRIRSLPPTAGLREFDSALPPLTVTTRAAPFAAPEVVLLALDPGGAATAAVLRRRSA
jgi:3-oxoacyl-[acyl-carrier-protein] synthase II